MSLQFHRNWPWLVWLRGSSAGLRTTGSPVRAHACVTGQVLSLVHVKGNRSMYLSHIDVSLPLSPSLPLSLKVSKIFKKKLFSSSNTSSHQKLAQKTHNLSAPF